MKAFKGISLMVGILLATSSFANEHHGDHDRRGELMRADCRYHNSEGISGVNFCYSSIVYRVDKHSISDIRFGVGCDHQTIYNDGGTYFSSETVGDVVTALSSATPSVQLEPAFALLKTGTYTSALDTYFGRMLGSCFVRPVHADNDRDRDCRDGGQDGDQDCKDGDQDG